MTHRIKITKKSFKILFAIFLLTIYPSVSCKSSHFKLVSLSHKLLISPPDTQRSVVKLRSRSRSGDGLRTLEEFEYESEMVKGGCSLSMGGRVLQ